MSAVAAISVIYPPQCIVAARRLDGLVLVLVLVLSPAVFVLIRFRRLCIHPSPTLYPGTSQLRSSKPHHFLLFDQLETKATVLLAHTLFPIRSIPIPICVCIALPYSACLSSSYASSTFPRSPLLLFLDFSF
ncbi:hypothetical protein NDA14_004712 [Ustilago hordei]|uniref:Uncharacterized protein n=1 Tax=Ustilago hordei TaxID=120017 RepID=I2FXB1_USTHO|nr:uncharacterized protein UHO2_04362 [Ustilago hordei]KAJ1036963.1 hypothetical protein NDA10_004681 [Ustilago hordei]KAJ1573626.1 hypothetical protein NDA15_000181 [Ustilago hordei]KAJ1579621.1 hypothetical protein NDA12_002985 [Ustilago hordei]KAJ1598591.1 hypothetical protein NDA14_004712 [Ustilago hordei]CCF51554.1 uncharacterized protein UHOR_05503 [Ustilago hordei]